MDDDSWGFNKESRDDNRVEKARLSAALAEKMVEFLEDGGSIEQGPKQMSKQQYLAKVAEDKINGVSKKDAIYLKTVSYGKKWD